MKKLTFLFLLLASSLTSYAQEWKSDLNSALKEAAASGKNVLLFFTTTQDCNRCVSLEKTVLKSAEFVDYAKDNYVLVKEDFNIQNGQDMEDNLLIVEKYNKDGFFPLLVIISKNAKILGQLGAYNDETPEQYLAKLQSIKKS